MKYKTEYLFIKLIELMEKKQIIFIIADLHNYYIVTEKKVNSEEGHSVSIILNPSGVKSYDLFYINSHGAGAFAETIFETKISRKWIKKYEFKKSVNKALVGGFVSFLQT